MSAPAACGPRRSNELPATAVASAIREGTLDPVQHVEDCIRRIDARDDLIRAWSHVERTGAMRRAEALRDASAGAPLRGLCVGVKDVLDTADMPTAHGSPLYEGHVPERDSACVAALRAAGAVVLGKTRPTEFASPFAVGVRNPRDVARTAGVSSSGSAAAVADPMVPLALGTQTGGSIIRPAAYCGLVGFKPSIDAIDRGGIRHLRPSLDTVGLFARSVADAALLFSALADSPSGAQCEAAHGAPRSIGICRTLEWEHAGEATRDALERVVALVARADAQVEDVPLPPIFADALEAFRVIVVVETARAMSEDFARGVETMNPWLQGIAKSALSITDLHYRSALATAEECRDALRSVFDAFEVLVAPATAGEAPRRLSGLDDPWFGPLWTMMHGPALALPVMRGAGGMPVAVQIVGAPGADASVLEAARWMERALQIAGDRS